MRIHVFLRSLVIIATTLACPWSSPGQENQANAPHLALFRFDHPAMATQFTLFLYSPDAATARTISDEVFEEIDRLEQLLSNYRDSSELSRINDNAATQTVTTDPEMISFLDQAQHWSAASDGAFDITVGKLMKTWGFYRHQGRVPSEDELSRLRLVTGWRKLQVDSNARTVHFATAGLELDPGGIGKGFAVDVAVRILRADGVTSALLSAGSSTLYALGAPPHQKGWPVIVAGPVPSKDTLSTVLLRDTSLSSANCTEKNFTAHGHFYCHIMDPRTLHPVEGRLQVSIIDPSATASDALSNALFVDNPTQSFSMLRRNAPEANALVLSEENGRVQCDLFRWPAPIALTNCTSQ